MCSCLSWDHFFVLSSCVVLIFLSNGNGPFLYVMNVSIFTGFLLILCQHCLPIKGIFWFLILVSYICGCVHKVIYYHKTEAVANFLAWKQYFCFRYLLALRMCILMGVAGSCGAGLLFVLALVCCRWATLKLLVLNYAFKIPHITLPLHDKPMKQTSVMHDHNPVICKNT